MSAEIAEILSDTGKDTNIIAGKPLEGALLKIQKDNDNIRRAEQEELISSTKKSVRSWNRNFLLKYYGTREKLLASLSPAERLELSQTIPQKAAETLARVRRVRNWWAAATVPASSLVPGGIYILAVSVDIPASNPGVLLFIGGLVMVIAGVAATITSAKKFLASKIRGTAEWRYLQNLAYLKSHLSEDELKELLSE